MRERVREWYDVIKLMLPFWLKNNSFFLLFLFRRAYVIDSDS